MSFEETSLELKHNVASIKVVDNPSFIAGEALRSTIKATKRIVKNNFAAPKEEAAAKHKKIVRLEKEQLAELNEQDDIIAAKLFAYAEIERKRLAEIAAKEAAERAEIERKAKEDADAIAKLEEDGNFEEAAKVLAATPEPPPEAVQEPVAAPKVKGSREYWSHEVVDMKAFVAACLAGEGHLDINCLEPSKELGERVRTYRERFNGLGVKVDSETR